MLTNQSLPPAEWLHDKRCMAEAVISAVQNMRDDLSTSHDFVLNLQDNMPLSLAREYLLTGLQTCTCARTCPHGRGPWDCTEGSELSREKYCDECLSDKISEAVAQGDLDLADEYVYQLWSRTSDADLIEQYRKSRFHPRQRATAERVAAERCLELPIF